MDKPSNPEKKDEESLDTTLDNNVRILYITLAIVVGILILWIIIVIWTKEDPIKILNMMTDISHHITAV